MSTTFDAAEKVMREADCGATTIVAFCFRGDDCAPIESFGVELHELEAIYDYLEKRINRAYDE